MISVIILTKNSEETLSSSLKALKDFEEILVLDTGSTDLTLDIAKNFQNVKLMENPFIGFGPLRNLAAAKAKNDWILSIDHDEIMTKRLAMEILSLELDETSIYSFPFWNYFNGKKIRGCGWFPDRHVRLYNRKNTKFSEVAVHEKVLTNHLKHVKLSSPIKHYSYRSVSDFLVKMENYSTLFAKQHKHKKSASLKKALFHSFFAFIKSYLIQRGFLDGKEGWIISLYISHVTYYKYLKLQEENQTDAAFSSLS